MKTPLLERIPATEAERKTLELCGHERDGARCMRLRGHADRHESLYVRGQDVVCWNG